MNRQHKCMNCKRLFHCADCAQAVRQSIKRKRWALYGGKHKYVLRFLCDECERKEKAA